MSVPELVEHLGWPRNRINACLTTARANHPGKFFRIVSYRKQVGVQGRETPVYSATPGPDARRPAFDRQHVIDRRHSYYLRNRAKRAAERRLRNGAAATWLSGLVPMARRVSGPGQ